MNGQVDRERALTLELLQAIDGRSDITQRHLADRLGVALGLANAYLKRCVRKGWVKVSQAPANRYLYYLTPKGFAEKSRLTALYLRDSFDFYRRASVSVSAVLRDCEDAGFRNLLLAGASELAEITLIRGREYDLRLVAVFDTEFVHDRFLGLPVWRTLEQAPGAGGFRSARPTLQDAMDAYESSAPTLPDAMQPAVQPIVNVCLITSINSPEAMFRRVAAAFGVGRVLAPDILGIRIESSGEPLP